MDVSILGSTISVSPPSECPLCHHAIAPTLLGTSTTDTVLHTKSRFEVTFQCTQHECGRVIIGRYANLPHKGFTLISVAPVAVKPPSIPEEVAAISPSFKKIYTQASAAESYKLDEISGVGYGKALEFLIKDYCIRMTPEEEENIKKKRLAKCIEDHVDDANIQKCAMRATWLRNDETHYVRKWEEKDTDDLKVLIRLTMGWIVNRVLTQQYESEMP